MSRKEAAKQLWAIYCAYEVRPIKLATAYEIRRIAREGFSMELTGPQADTLATQVQLAKDAAMLDMNNNE